jgi:hypothetical protein
MSWVDDTLADFMAWYGAVPPDEAAATRALTLALATVETWLDRGLERLERVETYDQACAILLRAWPVESVASLTVGQAATVIGPDQYTLDKRRGILTPGGYYWSATVTYTGGLEPFPADLTQALWSVAAALYPGAGSAAGGDTGGAVRRITTPDAGTVEFASTSSSGTRSADMLLGGILSPAIEAALNRYRAESAIGVG